MSLSTDSFNKLCTVKSSVEKCANNIPSLMVMNGCKLVFIRCRYHQWPVLENVQVGNEVIGLRPSARNLKVICAQYVLDHRSCWVNQSLM